MSSTFGSFTTARLGIYAAQKGLDVTGNNITNINTPGYTRQRLDQVSLVTTASDKYFSQYNTRVGQGVLTTGVSQLRDPGLDLLYRDAQANVGSYGEMLDRLNGIANILDEVGKGDGEQDDGVILNQMNDLRDLINQAITHGVDSYNSLIRTSAKALCRLFNKAATDLENLKVRYETDLKQDVSRVNTVLSSIQELNVSIRNADIRGDAALELRDERNRLLDELSSYVKIDVTYSMEDVGAGVKVEKLTVSMGSGDKNTLVDGEYATQFSFSSPMKNPDYPNQSDLPYWDDTNKQATADISNATMVENPNYGITLEPLKDTYGDQADPDDLYGTPLDDTDLYGSIQSLREALTEEGEYATQQDIDADPNAAIKRGLPYYQMALDSLAKEFAEMFNQTNQITPNMAVNVYQMDATGQFFVNKEDQTKNIMGWGANGTQNTPLTADSFDLDKVKQAIIANAGATPPSDSEAERQANELIYKNLEVLRQQGVLTDAYASYTGGPLFSNSSSGNDTSNITAATISISKGWADDTVAVVSSMEANASTGDTSNLAAFLDLFNKKQAFDPTDIDANATGAIYNGSFEDMLLRIQSTLAEDQMSTSDVYNNYTLTSNEAYTSRDSVSGVDLNDEATNLMVYQKAYTAACRLMTTLNDALDSLLAM